MLQPETITLGGHDYRLTPLPAWHSLEALHTLTRIAGPVLAKLQGGGGLAEFAEGIGAALATASPAEVVALSKKLLEPCLLVTPDGKQVALLSVFDTHFQGRSMDVLKLVAFAVRVNFRDFYDAALQAGKVAAVAAAKKPTTP